MKQYIELINDVIENGVMRGDRTGTGTKSVFGRQLRFNLEEGFPLLTTKKMFLRGIIEELLWILDGDTNIDRLLKNDVHIWDAWADKDGNLGPSYGEQWRAYGGVGPCGGLAVKDQMAELVHDLKTKPYSRRHVVTAWNPIDLPDETMSPQENVACGRMALAPCHCLFQFYVSPRPPEVIIDDLMKVRPALGLHRNNDTGNPVLLELARKFSVPILKLDCQLYQR